MKKALQYDPENPQTLQVRLRVKRRYSDNTVTKTNEAETDMNT